jgi:hypothetical protein
MPSDRWLKSVPKEPASTPARNVSQADVRRLQLEKQRRQEESQLRQSSQPLESSQLPELPPAGHESSQLQQSSQLPESSQPSRSGHIREIEPLNLMASLPDVRGHVEQPHQIVDHLFRHLDVYEQAAFTQLYRLSWGFGNKTCFISNPKLAERSNMSESQVKKVVVKLIAKGLARKTGNVQGFGKNQGVEYEVAAPSWGIQRSSQLQQSRQIPRSSQLQQSPNKEEEKEINKAADFVQCPDCFGTGWYYPEGTGKGAKPGCSHPRLKS